MGAVGAEDRFFVAFAENEDEVAFSSFFEGEFDSGFAIRFGEEVFAFYLARFFGAFDETSHDLI